MLLPTDPNKIGQCNTQPSLDLVHVAVTVLKARTTWKTSTRREQSRSRLGSASWFVASPCRSFVVAPFRASCARCAASPSPLAVLQPTRSAICHFEISVGHYPQQVPSRRDRPTPGRAPHQAYRCRSQTAGTGLLAASCSIDLSFRGRRGSAFGVAVLLDTGLAPGAKVSKSKGWHIHGLAHDDHGVLSRVILGKDLAQRFAARRLCWGCGRLRGCVRQLSIKVSLTPCAFVSETTPATSRIPRRILGGALQPPSLLLLVRVFIGHDLHPIDDSVLVPAEIFAKPDDIDLAAPAGNIE